MRDLIKDLKITIKASNDCEKDNKIEQLILDYIKKVETEKYTNYSRCSTQLPGDLEAVLAKIEHINDLGKSSWYEVVFNDGDWCSYQGSKTFEDGEKVVNWRYCKAIV